MTSTEQTGEDISQTEADKKLSKRAACFSKKEACRHERSAQNWRWGVIISFLLLIIATIVFICLYFIIDSYSWQFSFLTLSSFTTLYTLLSVSIKNYNKEKNLEYFNRNRAMVASSMEGFSYGKGADYYRARLVLLAYLNVFAPYPDNKQNSDKLGQLYYLEQIIKKVDSAQ